MKDGQSSFSFAFGLTVMEEHCLVTTKKMLMFYLLIYIQMYIKIYMDITISYWPGDAEIFLCFILTYKARENFVLLSCRISMKVLFSPIFWQLTSVKLCLFCGWVYGLYGSLWLFFWRKEIFLGKRSRFTPKSNGQFSSEDSATLV